MGIKNFIDKLLNNHFEIIKSEVEEYDYPIDYYYFSDKYGDFDNPTRNKYEDLREQVNALKRKLENAGYIVKLDMRDGLRLTVSKNSTDYNDKEIISNDIISVSENIKKFKYLKKFNK